MRTTDARRIEIELADSTPLRHGGQGGSHPVGDKLGGGLQELGTASLPFLASVF
jgi:hypothetical protein